LGIVSTFEKGKQNMSAEGGARVSVAISDDVVLILFFNCVNQLINDSFLPKICPINFAQKFGYLHEKISFELW
jgi:hypothetical protein